MLPFVPAEEICLFDSSNSDAGDRHPQLLIPALAPFYARGGTVSYALLRLGFGLTIVTHGVPKLTRSAHGSMADPMQGSIQMIENVLDLPFAPQFAMFVALLEAFGGLAVTIGFATRFFAPALAIQMAAICFALGPNYPWIDRGIEYPIILGLIALLISMNGAGAWSVDRALGREL
jgi:putative oxidoreductase